LALSIICHAKMLFAKKKAELMAMEEKSRRGSKFLDHSVVREIRPAGAAPRPSGLPKSLGDILSSSDLRYKFRLFLKERHSAESLMFYESIELYEKIQDPKWQKRAAEGLISKFVMEDSELQVNISAICTTRLLRVTKWEQSTFADAKSEIYDLLKTNFFAAFVAREFLMDG
jgi:hypothetical protein